MKKFILTIALVASFASTFVSCSADDSDLQESNAQADTATGILPPTRANP
ncbi:hypothetical protein ACLI1A_16915 [Flavobacterium sp. RHBU_3]